MRHRFVAAIVAICLFFGASPARADYDPILGPPNSSGAKAKKVTVVAIFGASLLAWGTSFLFLAQASSAASDRRELSLANGGTGNLGANDPACRTADQCARLAQLRHDQGAAVDRFYIAGAVGAGLTLAGVATVLLWRLPEKESATAARLTPAVTAQGGGMTFEGRF